MNSPVNPRCTRRAPSLVSLAILPLALCAQDAAPSAPGEGQVDLPMMVVTAAGFTQEIAHSYRISEFVTINATINNLLDRDFNDYRPYVSNTATGAVSYTNLYNNNQEPRRRWLSATCTS